MPTFLTYSAIKKYWAIIFANKKRRIKCHIGILHRSKWVDNQVILFACDSIFIWTVRFTACHIELFLYTLSSFYLMYNRNIRKNIQKCFWRTYCSLLIITNARDIEGFLFFQTLQYNNVSCLLFCTGIYRIFFICKKSQKNSKRKFEYQK